MANPERVGIYHGDAPGGGQTPEHPLFASFIGREFSFYDGAREDIRRVIRDERLRFDAPDGSSWAGEGNTLYLLRNSAPTRQEEGVVERLSIKINGEEHRLASLAVEDREERTVSIYYFLARKISGRLRNSWVPVLDSLVVLKSREEGDIKEEDGLVVNSTLTYVHSQLLEAEQILLRQSDGPMEVTSITLRRGREKRWSPQLAIHRFFLGPEAPLEVLRVTPPDEFSESSQLPSVPYLDRTLTYFGNRSVAAFEVEYELSREAGEGRELSDPRDLPWNWSGVTVHLESQGQEYTSRPLGHYRARIQRGVKALSGMRLSPKDVLSAIGENRPAIDPSTIQGE